MAIVKIAEGSLLVNDIPANEALADIEITNRFIKLAEQMKRIAPRSDDFLYMTAIFMHSAEHALIDPKTGEPKKDNDGKVITGGFDDKWKWHCSDPSIQPYSNANGDIFGETELKKAYMKFQGKPLCINHLSNDVEGVRGIIIDTHYDDKFKRIVGLIALDRKTYPDLAHKVRSGQTTNVSMGTSVGRAICTLCLKSAATANDYCECMRSKKGQVINGIKVGEINVDLMPLEISLVVTPADAQAKVLKIIASMNNYVDQRNPLLEEKDQVETTKLAKLDNSITTIGNQLNRLFSECSDNSCQFVRSSDGHIKMVKSAQESPKYSWKDFFDTAKEIDGADDYEKRPLFDSLKEMLQLLKTEDLRDNPDALVEFTDVMTSKNKYLHENILQPILEQLKSTEQDGATPPMQDNQFTTPNGPDKDLGLDSGSEVSMPANEQQTGGRINKVVNPSETDAKPNKGGDTGPELGSPSDRFQFGNYASNEVMLMATGGKKTADIDENLNLLLRQTQEIEQEMNTIKNEISPNTKMNSPVNAPVAMEELKMNEARLKLRAAQRAALLKQAEKEEEKCEECDKVECECEEEKTEKKAYWQGTTEPTPGKPQYKADPLAAKDRMEDKQMKQDKSMGGADGSFPGDEAEKKKLLRAELEQRALQRRAYWQGTEEPKPGQVQYKPDNGGEPKARMNDKQMKQDKSMGGADGAFPGDEAEKKKLLRAELVPGILRTKFTKVRDNDGEINKSASYFEIFAGEKKLLKATAEEIFGDELDASWDVLSSPEYGKEVMATIRSEGFAKVAYLLKGAQAAPMPELPPALDAGGGDKADAPQMKQVNVNEVMSLLGEAEDKLAAVKQALTGEDDGEVKGMSVETGDEGPSPSAELTASIQEIGREVYAELDKSADELALLVDYFEKAASLSHSKKAELNSLAIDAIADGQALLEEADTILAVAGKVPPGLKAFQDKQKGKKKDDGKDKDKKDDKKKDKKEDKEDKKKDKKDDKKDKKKKSKKAELLEALLKLASEIDGEEDGMDELDKDMMELGLLPKEDKADDVVVEHAPPVPPVPPARKEEEQDLAKTKEFMDAAKANKAEDCGMCGMAMDAEHLCTASAKNELVREALATRRLKREALLKSAEGKLYDVVPDTHGLEGEAHKGSEANPTTQLDIKPAGDGAMIEGIDKKHDVMMGAAESTPTGKEGSRNVEVKEAEIKAELDASLKTKKAEDDKTKFRVKLRRAYDLGLEMQEKGMIGRTKESLDNQVDEIIKFSDESFESYKRAVANTQAAVKTASLKSLPQPGVREDNSQLGDNGGSEGTLSDVLKTLDWK